MPAFSREKGVAVGCGGASIPIAWQRFVKRSGLELTQTQKVPLPAVVNRSTPDNPEVEAQAVAIALALMELLKVKTPVAVG